jgi:glycosyltransferase involved in cell wall biosynthesis
VWTPHGVLQRWAGSRRTIVKAGWERICRTLMPRKSILHATSEQEAMASRKPFPGTECMVIPFGHHVQGQICHEEGGQALRLLFLGRLDPKKGIENLLDACRLLKSTLPRSFSLTVAGEGDSRYAASLQSRIRESGLQEHVRMVGDVRGEDKRTLLRRTDLLVVPSYTENFAVVVAEALAHGIPVIASTGTPWQQVEEVGCGLWVDNAPASLASAIRKMSDAPLQKMGHQGREWLKREFRWDVAARRIMKCYERALVSHGGEQASFYGSRSSSHELVGRD